MRQTEATFQGGRNDGDVPPEEKKSTEQPKETAASPPAPALVAPITPSWMSNLPGSLGKVLEGLGQTALVVVLVVFMLLRREDLRNRVIRLIGHGRLTLTTMAIDDAASHISRFLFAQLVVNSCYGLVFAAGLWLLGIPYAFLWGFWRRPCDMCPMLASGSRCCRP